MRYEPFYSMARSLQKLADYLRQVLDGIPHERIVSVTHSMALGDSGPQPVMFYSAVAVVRTDDTAS
jgi:hypothetical protein